MAGQPELRTAAKAAMEGGLRMEEGDELLLVVDEDTVELADSFIDAAPDISVDVAVVYFPRASQERYLKTRQFPLSMADALQSSSHLLTCLSSEARYMSARSDLIDLCWRHTAKVAAMPGACRETLLACAVDYSALTEQCNVVASVLARGEELQLFTSHENREYTLVAKLGKWERLPVPSDGVIPPGAWGNIPSGETYISPIEGTAEGDIIIDGSIPGLVIGGKRPPIRLTFQEGRLISVVDSASTTARHLQENQIKHAEENCDPNWSNLAEVGIGLNREVKELSGLMLLDEKAYGTAHVAIGSSEGYGGQVSSTIHCDMVTLNPRVTVDGVTLMEGGNLGSWAESSFFDPQERQLLMDDEVLVRRTSARSKRDDDLLLREWTCDAGRIVRTPVGRGESSLLAGRVLEEVQKSRGGLRLPTLARRTNDLSSELLVDALLLLSSYDLVDITSR